MKTEDFARSPSLNLIKKFIRVFVAFCKRQIFSMTKFLCKTSKPRIFLSYESEGKPDGVGAQIQRILAIRSLCCNLSLGYVHTGIKSVAVHPLDPYQSPGELEEFLIRLNTLFFMTDSEVVKDESSRSIMVRNLSFRILLKYMFISFVTGKTFKISCVEPYPVSEYDPLKYKNILNFLPNFPSRTIGSRKIAIHYRRGVGGFAVQAGEKISRELEGNYFRNLLKEIVKPLVHLGNTEIKVFTDSPSYDLSYSPPTNQHHLWVNSPKFESGIMNVQGMQLGDLFSDSDLPVSIIYGGDPLDAIIQMSSSDYLLMSRSSFSYVAALLNKSGQVFFPKSFWHGAKPGWKVIDETKYV